MIGALDDRESPKLKIGGSYSQDRTRKKRTKVGENGQLERKIRMKTARFSRKQVESAIIGTRGIKATIAARLGCSRQTLENYLMRYPELREILAQERETIIDLAESKLVEAVEQGETRAVMFVLETMGKGRGWSKRTEITGADGAPLVLPADVLEALRARGIEASEVVAQFVEMIRAGAELGE